MVLLLLQGCVRSSRNLSHRLISFRPKVRMFPELRRTKRVGTFGVAYAGGGTYERCLVDQRTGKVSSFVTNWVGGRKFPVGECQHTVCINIINHLRTTRIVCLSQTIL
jgi:hypothetical protein